MTDVEVSEVSDRTLWRVPGGGVLYRMPALADGTVYVLDDLFGLAAIDADTGQRRWTLRVDAGIGTSPVAGDGVVYFADTVGCLTAVDAATGEVRWKWRARRSKTSNPTVADHVVYSVAHDGTMRAVDGLTGQPLWNAKVADHHTPNDPSPAVSQGFLYAAVGGRLLALDTATGSRRWNGTSLRRRFTDADGDWRRRVRGQRRRPGRDGRGDGRGMLAVVSRSRVGEPRGGRGHRGRRCRGLVSDRGGHRDRSGEVAGEDPR